jgi:protein-disulfide isomerase
VGKFGPYLFDGPNYQKEKNMSPETETAGKHSGRKEKENLSKRQARKEELRRKNQQQRILVIGGIALLVILIGVFLVLPAVRKVSSTSSVQPFEKITPVAYKDADGFHLGDPNAKVKLEVFEDFDCSACRNYSTTVEPDVISKLVETGQVYYTFYQFPFLDDRLADKPSDRAANAAMCAADQNRFWDYKKLLFLNQTANESVGHNDTTLMAMADSLGLDSAAFKACYNAKRFQSTIDEHLKLGEKYAVQGTPSLYVNGREVSPGRVPTFEEIQAAVQAAMTGSN